MNDSTIKDTKFWRVKIEVRGQAGSVHYIEGTQSATFDWEFGAYDIIAMVWGPEPDHWDSKYPWASGRRKEIMRRIADEVIKQKAMNCIAEFDYERTYIKIRNK